MKINDRGYTMKVYTMKFTGNEYYLIIDLLNEYAKKCFADSEKEYKNQSEAWNENYKQVKRECAINAKDLAQKMYANARR